jgi:hypothetical protein
MPTKAIELDKTWTAGVGQSDTYGTIVIRVVVVPPKESEEGTPVIQDPDEPLSEGGSGPLDSYLERPRGEGYVVFLVHGQRHDNLDESFVQRELGYKYLRTRTMIIIDVDGLASHAIAELVQGSRQGMYRGKVYDAILDRVIAVLKKDPDLTKLELDAEQKIAELKTGDESVRRKLDQLIEGHHAAGQQGLPGEGASGAQGGGTGDLKGEFKAQDVVVHATPNVGETASEPVLLAEPTSAIFRLHPDEEKLITLHAAPTTEWARVQSKELKLKLVPVIPELEITLNEISNGAELKLKFNEPDDFPSEDYPIKTRLTVFANFDGSPEPRVVERTVVIAPKHPRPPVVPPVLKAEPTFLRVASRQPVNLVPGGASTHVRLKWDGEDHLTSGWPPLWVLSARCLSLESFPTPIFSKPRSGNIELLLDTPHGLLTGQQLEFQVDASGPGGVRLVTVFVGEVTEPAPGPEPRKTKDEAPSAPTQRRRPYELKIIQESQWDSPCWDSLKWTQHDAGCFEEATASSPLTLIVNEDAAVLKEARAKMLGRQLDEDTIKERLGRYTAHIYFHLYNMFEYVQTKDREKDADDTVRVPSQAELRAEINRVALTLAGLMDR